MLPLVASTIVSPGFRLPILYADFNPDYYNPIEIFLELGGSNRTERTNNNQKYYTRKKISSFKSKKSPHVINAMKMYKVDNLKPSKKLARKTKCSLKSLKRMMKKGQGAYFSSGSRPNQTAHSWGVARLASAITGGKASAVDYNILKDGCKPSSKALKLATRQRKKYKYGRRRIAKRMVGGKKSTYRMKETLVGFEKASNPKKWNPRIGLIDPGNRDPANH